MQQPQTMQLANITTEQIQKCLDDNKQLIMAIMEYQNMGKIAESASYQAQLQHNLMYLAKIADAQPPASSAPQGTNKLLQMSAQPVKLQEQFVTTAQLGAQQQPGFTVSKPSFLSNNQQQQQQQQQQQHHHHQQQQQQQQQQQSPVVFQQQQVFQEQTGIRGGNLYHGMHAGFGNNFMNMQQQESAFGNSDAGTSLQEHGNRGES